MGGTTTRLIVRIVLSMGLMGAGLFILISGGSSDELENAAFIWIGIILGYWLR